MQYPAGILGGGAPTHDQARADVTTRSCFCSNLSFKLFIHFAAMTLSKPAREVPPGATPSKKPKVADAVSPAATPPSASAGGSTPSSSCAEESFPDPGWPLDSEKAKLRAPQYMMKVIPFARQSFERALKTNKKLQENLNHDTGGSGVDSSSYDVGDDC